VVQLEWQSRPSKTVKHLEGEGGGVGVARVAGGVVMVVVEGVYLEVRKVVTVRIGAAERA
jgi:hypothetical protein